MLHLRLWIFLYNDHIFGDLEQIDLINKRDAEICWALMFQRHLRKSIAHVQKMVPFSNPALFKPDPNDNRSYMRSDFWKSIAKTGLPFRAAAVAAAGEGGGDSVKVFRVDPDPDAKPLLRNCMFPLEYEQSTHVCLSGRGRSCDRCINTCSCADEWPLMKHWNCRQIYLDVGDPRKA